MNPMTFKTHIIKLLLLSTLLPIFANSQNCTNYHKIHGVHSSNKYYQYNDASRSAMFVKGETSQLYLDVYNGRDYRIYLCHDDVLGSSIRLQIYDRSDNTLLYDNSNDDFVQEFEFTVTKTRELILVISVPGNSIGLEKASQEKGLFKKDLESGCIGVYIEHMITPVKGF